MIDWTSSSDWVRTPYLCAIIVRLWCCNNIQLWKSIKPDWIQAQVRMQTTYYYGSCSASWASKPHRAVFRRYTWAIIACRTPSNHWSLWFSSQQTFARNSTTKVEFLSESKCLRVQTNGHVRLPNNYLSILSFTNAIFQVAVTETERFPAVSRDKINEINFMHQWLMRNQTIRRSARMVH